MNMDTQRLILLFIFGFSLLMLWEAWQKESRPKPAVQSAQQGVAAPSQPVPSPSKPAATAPAERSAGVPEAAAAATRGEIVRVRTDLFIAEIDTLGATLKGLQLLKHKDSVDPNKNFVLFGPEHQYEAQSGLTGDSGPNHRTLWRVQAREYALEDGKDTVEVRLSAAGRDGVAVDKIYSFRRDSYVVDVSLDIRNNGSVAIAPYAYFQLAHDGKPAADANTLAQSFGAQSFIGFAVYSKEKKFEKVHPSDIDKGKVDVIRRSDDGWLAFVQHYFVSAWLFPDGVTREYVFEKRPDGVYVGRILVPVASLAPGAGAQLTERLYAGPQEQQRLKAAAPGLDLVVDYGCAPNIA